MTLDEPIPGDLITNTIEMIYENSKIKPEIRFEKGSKVGEGFLGITSNVQVKIGDEVRHFFMKIMPQNEKIRKVLSIDEMFQREAEFYLKIRPLFEEIHLKYLKKSFDITPKCFLIKNDSDMKYKEAVVLENIGIRGFSTDGGRQTLDKDHLMLALKTYARLHATGFILKSNYPGVFQELLNKNKNLLIKALKVYDLNKLMSFGLDILKEHCSIEEDKFIIDNIDRIKATTIDVLKFEDASEEHATILHYDCWKNNLMFRKKNGSNNVEDLKLIDMQMWLINSPVFDILHLIYCNVSPEGGVEFLDFYFHYYYDSLRSAILEMKGDPDVIYPKEVYLYHVKKYSFYGLFMAILVLRVVLADPNDVPNLAEMITHDVPLDDALIYKLPNEESYAERLKVIVKHFIKNQIL